MAASNEPTDDAQPTDEPTVKKDVTVLLYAEDPDLDERAFAQELAPGTDMYEKTETVMTTHYIEYTDSEDNDRDVWLPEGAFEALAGDVDSFDPEASGSLVTKTERNVSYAEDLDSALYDLQRTLAAAVDDEALSHSLTPGHFAGDWQDGLSETRVSLIGDDIDRMRVLTHQAERDADQRYEGDEDHAVGKLTVSLEGTEDEVSDWSDEIVGPILRAAADVDSVGKVRVSDCTKRVEREGDCFDAL